MRIRLVDNNSNYLTELTRLLAPHEISRLPFNSPGLTSTNNIDLVILSGGGHDFPVVGNEFIYKNELDLIDKSECPILGICLGFD